MPIMPGTGVMPNWPIIGVALTPTGVWSHRERLGVSPGAPPVVGPAGVSSQRERFFLTTIASCEAEAVLASSHSPARPASFMTTSPAGRSGSATSHRFRRGVASAASMAILFAFASSVPSSRCFCCACCTFCSCRSSSASRIASP